MKVGGKNIFGRATPLFGSKCTISRFGEHFRDGQYSLVSLLFAVLLTVPPHAQPFVKQSGGGGHVPPVPHGVGATVCMQRRLQGAAKKSNP